MIASKVQPSTVNQIVAVACSALILAYNIAKSLNQCSLRDQQVKRLERAAVHAMREQREKFIKLVQDENLKWDKTVQQGFDQMLICACKETFDLRLHYSEYYRKQVFPIIGSYLYFVAIDIILILLCLTVGVKHRKV